MGAELTPGRNLLAGQVGLLRGEEARVSLPVDGMGEAVVRAVASLGVTRASATRFAALDRPFGKGAATHRLRIG